MRLGQPVLPKLEIAPFDVLKNEGKEKREGGDANPSHTSTQKLQNELG
jgi:hypothetical protein